MMQNPDSLFQQAQTALQLGHLDTAKSLLLKVIHLVPTFADGQHLLGIVCYQQNASKEAANYIATAVKLQPKNLQFLNNYALTLNALSLPNEAIIYLQQAILLAPKDLDIQLNIANTLLSLDRFDEAAGYYRRLLRIQPQRHDVRDALCHCLVKIGNLAQQLGQFKLAEAAFAEVITFNTKEADYFYNLANAQRELGLAQLALTNYQKALVLNPNDADIYNNLGNVQRELGQLDLAIASYQQALHYNPKLQHALVHLVHQKQQVCDWQHLDANIQTIRGWVKHQPKAQVSPFAFLAMPSTTAAEQLQCASQWVAQRYAGYLKQPAQQPKSNQLSHHADQPKKIKIAYLSADFRLHPLAFLITDLIHMHDKHQFEVFGFSYGVNDKTPARLALEKAFTHFYDIKDWSEIAAADKIRALKIDILVDLTGFTQSSRTGIVALKPAPVTVNWLGFPGTMGQYQHQEKNAPLFDYLLTDAIITPTHNAAHYAETLLQMPYCYQPNNHSRPLANPPSRSACDLPDNAFVFCCFNQTFKITPDVFSVWMGLLRAVPHSVLWLLAGHPRATANLTQEANAAGVAKERLIFAPRVKIEEHLARHVHADLFLDTLPYNAHTTCSDALWMGLPVLTCMGETFASRVAASLIQASGLADSDAASLITHDLAQYYAQALQFAQNPQRITHLKLALMKLRDTSPLFDTANFVRALEQHYQAIINKPTVA